MDILDQLEFDISILIYKYSFSLEEALHLTLPQLEILKRNLIKIVQMENGTDENGKEIDTTNTSGSSSGFHGMSKPQMNTFATEQAYKMLKEKTGRKTFSLMEVLNPMKALSDWEAKKAKEGLNPIKKEE